MKNAIPLLPAVVTVSLLLAAGAVTAADTGSKSDSNGKGNSWGVNISDTATAQDIGLPLYPGAKPHVKEGNSSSAANVGIGLGALGMKLVVVSYASTSNAQEVAAYYRQALAKYGPVLDCTDRAAADETTAKTGLSCDSDDSGSPKNAFKYKVGKKDEQRIAVGQVNGTGSTFQLVYLNKK